MNILMAASTMCSRNTRTLMETAYSKVMLMVQSAYTTGPFVWQAAESQVNHQEPLPKKRYPYLKQSISYNISYVLDWYYVLNHFSMHAI